MRRSLGTVSIKSWNWIERDREFLKIYIYIFFVAIFHACASLLTNRPTNANLPIYLFFFFDRDDGFPTVFSIFSVKFDPYLSFDCSMKSCGETNVTLKKKKKIYRIYKVWNIRDIVSKCHCYLNCGTLNGRRRLLTTGGTSLDFGRAGLLAQRAALVNCETREKFLSGPDVVRKTFLIFDLSPEDDDDNGVAGIGTTCIKIY